MKSFFNKLKIISLCLFAFSLGIEYWDPLGIRDVFTITRFAGLMYAFFALMNFKNSFAITSQNKILIYCALFLWFWITFISILSTGIIGGDLTFFLGLLQVVILYWLVLNDVANNLKIRKYVFTSFIIGIVFVSILLSFGIGIENSEGNYVNEISKTRIYFMGMNPNRMGDLAAIAITLVFSLIYSGNNKNKMRYLFLLFLPSLLSIVGFSGSRGSFLLIFLGLSVFFVMKKSTVKKKIILVFIGLFSSILIYEFMSDFQVLQERLTLTIESGETGGRFKIWNDVFSIIQRNPIFGTGKSLYDLKMTSIYGVPKDSHNIFLYVWAVSGIIGLIILLSLYLKTFKNSLRNLNYYNDPTSLMIFIIAIFLVSKSGGAIEIKIIWLLLACIPPLQLKSSKKSFALKTNPS